MDTHSVAQRPKPAPSAGVTRSRGRPANNAPEVVDADRVLDLAFHHFARRGYEGTTMRGLAKELGVSHNLLNVRFGSKEALWRSAVDARVARIAPPVFAVFKLTGLDDDKRLGELIYRFCQWAADNPEFVNLTYSEGSRASWRLDYLVKAYILPFKQLLDELLASVAAKRSVRRMSTTALMAFLVQGVGCYFASGPLLDRIDGLPGSTSNEASGQVQVFADFIFAGLVD